MGVGYPVFNRNWHTSTTVLTSPSFEGRKLFELWLKKYTLLVYNRDDNFMYCKICTKAKKSNGLSKESQGRNFRNSICPQGYGTHVHRSETRSLLVM